MTFPLIAFALWLLSTSTLPVGNPAQKFIDTTGVQDPATKTLLLNTGQKIASDPALQSSLKDGRKGFAGWLGYFSDLANGAYPKNCRVYDSQVNLIANIPPGLQFEAKRKVAIKRAKTPVAIPDVRPPTPYPGIALALLSMSLPNLDDQAQLCNKYMCEEACATDIYLQLLFSGLKQPALQTNFPLMSGFYQQYLQILKSQSVDITSYPEGWTCEIKNDLDAASVLSLHNNHR